MAPCGSRSTLFQGGRELSGALCSRSFVLCRGGFFTSKRRQCGALSEVHSDHVASVNFQAMRYAIGTFFVKSERHVIVSTSTKQDCL